MNCDSIEGSLKNCRISFADVRVCCAVIPADFCV